MLAVCLTNAFDQQNCDDKYYCALVRSFVHFEAAGTTARGHSPRKKSVVGVHYLAKVSCRVAVARRSKRSSTSNIRE